MSFEEDVLGPLRLSSFDPTPRRRKAAPKPKAEASPALLAEIASLKADVAALKAAPVIDPAEHKVVKAELAALREEIETIKNAPARERYQESLKKVFLADMEWRAQLR